MTMSAKTSQNYQQSPHKTHEEVAMFTLYKEIQENGLTSFGYQEDAIEDGTTDNRYDSDTKKKKKKKTERKIVDKKVKHDGLSKKTQINQESCSENLTRTKSLNEKMKIKRSLVKDTKINQSNKNQSHQNYLQKQRKQDLTEKFLKRIKERKLIKSPISRKDEEYERESPQGNLLPKITQKIQIEHILENPIQTQAFEINQKMKESHSSIFLRYDNRYEKLIKRNSEKKVPNDEIFMKRSNTQIKKSLYSRKRLYTQIDKETQNLKSMCLKAKTNFYSQSKLTEQIQNERQESEEAEKGPMSPPSQDKFCLLIPRSKDESQDFKKKFKFPLIKKRNDKQLSQIDEKGEKDKQRERIITQRGTNRNPSTNTLKYQISAQKISKKNRKKYEQQKKSLFAKNFMPFSQQFQMALVNLSRSQVGFPQQIDPAWLNRKKDLLKKLGLKL